MLLRRAEGVTRDCIQCKGYMHDRNYDISCVTELMHRTKGMEAMSICFIQK
jgi:hypothetical protein